MKYRRHAKLTALVSLLVFCMVFGNLFSQSMDVDSLAEKMDLAIQKTMTEGKIPSVTVALVSGGEIVWSGFAGHSNLWAQTPAVLSTVYLIGSTFKTMSMFALLQQMEQGKFKLDERVNDYLIEFKIMGEDPDNPVTFRHLLTHTSGLPEAYGAHLVWGTTVPASLKDYLASSLKLQYPPMTKVIYSNMAYTLVAYLIEKPIVMDAKHLKILELQEPLYTILDPPRSGMNPRTLKRLNEIKPELIVFISCNVKLLRRELPYLSNYRIKSAALFDLFPQTPHQEAVIELVRI